MADLSKIEASETATITVMHPLSGDPVTDDDGNEMWVEVYGADSPHYKSVDHAIQNRNLNQASRKGGIRITAESADAQAFERTYKNIKAWHIVLNGETPEPTSGNAKRILQDHPWLREQIESAIHDRANFLNN